jgi:hypothetical protein
MAPVGGGLVQRHPRLGIHLPFFVVHDLGLLFTTPHGVGGWTNARRAAALAQIAPPAAVRGLLDEYAACCATSPPPTPPEDLRLAGARRAGRGAATRALADTYTAGATRPIGGVENAARWRLRRRRSAGCSAVRSQPLGFSSTWSPRACVYTSIELIDLETVRLLGMFKEDSAHGSEALGSALDVVDLFASLGSPEAADVANFSLDLLPSVLETKRASGVQTFTIDGYASIERRGNVDSLVLSELAYDREIFEQKVVDQELLTTATSASARRSTGCSTSWSTRRRRCAASARCSPAAWP